MRNDISVHEVVLPHPQEVIEPCQSVLSAWGFICELHFFIWLCNQSRFMAWVHIIVIIIIDPKFWDLFQLHLPAYTASLQYWYEYWYIGNN